MINLFVGGHIGTIQGERDSLDRPALFFVGLNPRWQMYKFLPRGLNVMFSAAGYWDKDNLIWRPGKPFKRSFGLKFLDSGGYLMLMRYGYYPFSVVNYANLVARLSPDYYASMDYACEPDLIDAKKTTLMAVKDRINATVKNALELAEWETHLPGQMVPVVQGYTLDEYLYCLGLYAQAGLIRDYMAVGSMCRRVSDDELAELIPGIYYAARKYGCSKLHFFGLKLSPSLAPYGDMIYSRDSAVTLDDYDPALRKRRGGRRWPRGQDEKKAVFKSFLSRLDELGLNYVNR